METTPDSEVNPYAPPASDAGATAMTGVTLLKRPKSVKWAIAILLLFTTVFSVTNAQFIRSQGWAAFTRAYQIYPWSLIMPLLRMAGLFALMVLGRKPLTYWMGVTALAAGCYDGTLNIWGAGSSSWRRAGASWSSHFAFEAIGTVVIGGVMVLSSYYLFYRFTFGKPSRRYYGMIPESV